MKKIIPIEIIIIQVLLAGCKQKISVTPPDAPPPDGYIFIDSNPSGADIYINDKYVRRATPDSINYLSASSYKITLKKENFRDTSFVVQITEGKRRGVLVDYTKDPLMYGKINCISTPDNASIFLNGIATGEKTPTVLYNILAGYYYVRYHLKNHMDDSVKVAVQSSSIVTATVKTLVDTSVWSFYSTSNTNLSTNDLTCLVVDPSNNVWIGTDERGLHTFYDGMVRQNFYYPLLPDAFSNVTVLGVAWDGTVWAGSNSGLTSIGPDGRHRYNEPDSAGPLSDPRIESIFTKPNNDTTYIATRTNVVKTFISSGQRFWHIDVSINHGWFYTSICVDNSGVIWLGTEQNGIFNINTGDKFRQANAPLGDNINTLAVSHSGVIWIGYNWIHALQTSVSYYDHGSIVAARIVPSNSNVNTIFIDQNDVKWIGTTKGLVEYNEATGSTLYDSLSTGLNINDVRGIRKDSFGRLWIATYGGEIFVKKK